jgi:hypothetical protein
MPDYCLFDGELRLFLSYEIVEFLLEPVDELFDACDLVHSPHVFSAEGEAVL